MMRGQFRVMHSLAADFSQRSLQRGEQLAFQLLFQCITPVIHRHISADIFVEQHRVCDAYRILA